MDARDADSDVTRTLFVCTANVCRSPMAEAISNALADEYGLPWRTESAGVAALVGEGISTKAGLALEEIGVFLRSHRARQVEAWMLEETDLVLAMTRHQADTLRRLSPPSSAKIHTLLSFTEGALGDEDVPDPYGQSMTAHRASVRQLWHHVEKVAAGIRATRDDREVRPD